MDCDGSGMMQQLQNTGPQADKVRHLKLNTEFMRSIISKEPWKQGSWV